MGTRGDRAEIRRARVRRGRSRLVSSPRILVVVFVTTLSMGVVFAHWSSETGAAMELATGDVALNVTGDLTFDFPGCAPGNESTTCDKFEGSDIGTSDISHSADGATFTITGWVYKGGDSSEPVGFYYTITGGTVDIVVKSGRNLDPATLPEGSGYWLNPACEGDPGPGKAVTCTPKNTNSVSNIEFCVKVSTPPTCLPLMRSVVASNVGSIPFDLNLSLIGPEGDGSDYCGVFDLTIQRVIDGSPADPPQYEGPLCDPIGAPFSLSEQIDPGGSEVYKLTLAFAEPTSDFNGTTGGFTVRFQATQWNQAGGWADLVDLPMAISVGAAPPSSVSSETISPVTSARIVTQTVAALVNSALPAVIDVLGRSEVTITSWALDPSDPSAVLGFEFTVKGDPVYVEVQRGALGWVDERWEEENPHVWHDPYGVDSPEARPITYIEFAPVPLPEEIAAEELPAEKPPAEEAPAEEPPAPDPAALSGIVWLDEDGDGVRASTESGMAGVVVRLLADGVVVATMTTDAGGSYSFLDLGPGDYTVEIEAPTGYVFAASGQGGDPALDSDVAPDPGDGPQTGLAAVSLSPGANSGIADAGLNSATTGGNGS